MSTETIARPRIEATDVVGYVLAVLVPLIGFIIGLIRLNKSKHGIWIVVVSTVVFFAYVLAMAGAAGGGGR